jgi:hypothetical protein
VKAVDPERIPHAAMQQGCARSQETEDRQHGIHCKTYYVYTWSKSCEDEVGRYLNSQIANEEDRDGGVELGPFQIEVSFDIEHSGTSQCISIQVAGDGAYMSGAAPVEAETRKDLLEDDNDEQYWHQSPV